MLGNRVGSVTSMVLNQMKESPCLSTSQRYARSFPGLQVHPRNPSWSQRQTLLFITKLGLLWVGLCRNTIWMKLQNNIKPINYREVHTMAGAGDKLGNQRSYYHAPNAVSLCLTATHNANYQCRPVRQLLFLQGEIKLSPVMFDGLSLHLLSKTTIICNFLCSLSPHFSTKAFQTQINILVQVPFLKTSAGQRMKSLTWAPQPVCLLLLLLLLLWRPQESMEYSSLSIST